MLIRSAPFDIWKTWDFFGLDELGQSYPHNSSLRKDQWTIGTLLNDTSGKERIINESIIGFIQIDARWRGLNEIEYDKIFLPCFIFR